MLSTLLFHLALAPIAAQAGPPPPPIVGGEIAPADSAPFAVALVDRGEVVCGGVLIAPDIVLTAAHCTISADAVLAGDVDLDGAPLQRAIVDAVRHPDWSSDTGVDVAVVALEAPLDLPVATLARACADTLGDGDEAWVLGWGSTRAEGTGSSRTLQRAAVTITDADCDQAAPCRDGLDIGRELFAGGDGRDACIGDSGGPLIDDDGVLLGIVARGDTGGAPCGEGGVYTRVDALQDWLVEATGLDPEDGRCEGGCGCSTGPIGLPGVVLTLFGLLLARRRC